MSAPKPYKVTRNGKHYWYHRKGKGARRLYQDPGTLAFDREFEQALASDRCVPLNTISDLCRHYQGSAVFVRLSKSTKYQWRRWLAKIDDHFGPLRISSFDSPRIKSKVQEWREQWAYSPRTADYAIQVLRRLLSHAIMHGVLTQNPCARPGKLYDANRAEKNWTDDEVEKLRKVASLQIMRVADLALLTCMRRGDLLDLKWDNVQDDCIRYTTNKSRGKIVVELPLYPALKTLLESFPRESDYVLTNSRGQNWRSGFSSSWNKAIKKTGIEKHFHDFRGTAVTRLKINGFQADEIALIAGWTEKSVENILKRYVSREEQFAAMKRRMNNALATKPSDG